jgi:5-hydroxyisourate hydrolase
VLEYFADGRWEELTRGITNKDGRITDLLSDTTALQTGTYRLNFATAFYFHQCSVEGFYPNVPVIFEIRDTAQHYHVPLLLSPFGYSTYRGS